MTICIIQLPSDFEKRYKEYRLKLGDKHTERTLDVATETQERAARDLAIVSGQMEVFTNNFSALSIIQEEIKRSDETVASIQKTIEANERFIQAMVRSVEPVLSVARDAQIQIEKLGIGRTLAQLQEPVENIYKKANEVREALEGIEVPALLQNTEFGSRNESFILAPSPSAVLNDQMTELIGITKSIEEKMPVQKMSYGPKFPFKIPAGTKWENILIQFTSNNYVSIQIAGHMHQTGYADMGFVDNRSQKPNYQWIFMLVLAKNNGSLLPSSPDANEKYKKQKQLLTSRLQEYFGIEYDPFETYNKRYNKNGYKIKLTLLPPPPEAEKIEIGQDDISNEITSVYNELTSQ